MTVTNVLHRIRSHFNGQTTEAFGSGQRYRLTQPMKENVKLHCISGFANVEMSGYTFERRHSDYPDAKSDIIIYDRTGEPVINGREFSRGPAAFWKAN